MLKSKTYQNNPSETDEDMGEDSGYLGGSPKQRVPARGPGFQPVKKTLPPRQRGDHAVLSAELEAFMEMWASAKRSHPGKTAMGGKLTDAKSLEQRTTRPDGDAATVLPRHKAR